MTFLSKSLNTQEKQIFFRSFERIMQGGKRKVAASGESAAKYLYCFSMVFAADSPLAPYLNGYLFSLSSFSH